MALLTRRLFLRYLLGLPLLSSFPLHVREIWADPPVLPNKGGNSIGEFFKGEELFYEIGVWLFKKVALGKLSFKEMRGKGRYIATLEGETLGVFGWVARYRVDTYRSIMEEIDEGKRLRSISFEEDVKIGNKLRRRTHFFDYQKRKWIQVRQKKDGTKTRTEEEIPPGMVYDDFLTASYNFRYGVYGRIERGRKYTVATFPKKGASSYEVRVASKEEEEKRRKSEKSKGGKEYFVKLFLDPEVTHSKEGLIEGWLSKELCPMEGAIKDVVLFGDVRGTLIKKS
ncbi:MAG: hypothetical protein COZ69_09565 [Deltaproteobacteria bacterium CG_4_8_14_3_um_filter_45_9]|nr:MAG: hypothetical protein COS40_13265 [Deltaproteobacteria bacterium CG03_land_8_20_14_0_80_45_14]PIX23040.1 MAG: hypothetical protein COZ69_09565 [Deltaproteobacteria bacterium CG_4_8_14_3_um_filter_45_9]